MRPTFRYLAWLYGVAVLGGAAVFASASGRPTTAPIRRPQLGALLALGGTVEVSSAELSQGHPLFAVDGAAPPRSLQAWRPTPDDAAPWIELRWPLPIDISALSPQSDPPALWEAQCDGPGRQPWMGSLLDGKRTLCRCQGITRLRLTQKSPRVAGLFEIGAAP